MSKNTLLSELINYISANSSGNVVIAAPTSGFALDVTGTGRFTGALSGTSATFTTGLIVSNTSDVYPEFKTSALDADAFLGFSNTGDGNAAWSIGRRNTGEFWISTYTGNFNSGTRTQPLVIATSGAATFSSSIDMGLNKLFTGGGYKMHYRNSSTNITFSGTSNWQINNDADNVVLMTVLNSGNVGIGTTSPSERLDIAGNALLNGDGTWIKYSGANAFFGSASTISGGSVAQLGIRSGSEILFATNGATERMRITSGGNVGIGLTSPSELLTAAGNIFVNGGNGQGFKLNGGLAIYRLAGDDLGLYTASTERMRITSGGNVGIGTTAPNGGLTVVAPSSSTAISLWGRAGDNYSALRFQSNTGATTYSTIYTNASDLIFENGGSERMRITSGGQLLLGLTSDPLSSSSALVIKATGTTFSAGLQRALEIYDAGAGGGEGGAIVFSSLTCPSNAAIYSSAQNPGADLILATNSANTGFPSERMRILSNGRILINSTADTGDQFQVNGAVVSKGADAILYTQARDLSVFYGFYATNNTSLLFYSSTGGTVGNFNRTSGIYTPTSNVNKKKDFEVSNIGLAEVMQLKPTLFRMKDDFEGSNKILGFIAQEVKEFIPQAYVEEGDFIGLQDRPIIAALTKAVQELKSELDTLKNK